MIIPMNREGTARFYQDADELIRDIAEGYRQVIRDLYGAGCRNIQFDDCSWGVCADPNAQAIFGTDEAGLREIQEQLLRVNNLAMEGKPGDLTVNTHVCRGNFHSTWACRGGYDTVAETLFARENVDVFFLEYDDERSGGFEPLRAVPADKTVVLGLVTTKAPKLEDKAEVIGRIREAARYVPLERLCLIPQCGFASCETGNRLTEEGQWANPCTGRRLLFRFQRYFGFRGAAQHFCSSRAAAPRGLLLSRARQMCLGRTVSFSAILKTSFL